MAGYGYRAWAAKRSNTAAALVRDPYTTSRNAITPPVGPLIPLPRRVSPPAPYTGSGASG